MELVIGLGQYAVSNKKEDTIKTFALASCVAVTAYCPKQKVAGMIHIVLPFPTDNSSKAEQPGYFAETGIPLLMAKMCREYGCSEGELQIHMYGGADSIRENDVFNVGRRNIEAAVSVFADMGLTVHKAELGGKVSRTLTMDVETGAVKVHCQPIKI